MGMFGEIQQGISKNELIRLLGRDFDSCFFLKDVEVIKYGYYEFFFDKEKLFGIQNDHLLADCSNHEEMIYFKNPYFEIDTWFLKVDENQTFSRVKSVLQAENISFQIAKSPYQPDFIKCESGVKLEFVETFFDFKEEKDIVISQKENFLLSSISLFV